MSTTVSTPVAAVRLGNGKKVHAATDLRPVVCAGNSSKVEPVVIEGGTIADVNCARCLKMLADAEGPVDTAPEAPEAPVEEHNHEEVAKDMAEQVANREHPSIRVAARLLPVLDLPDTLKKRIKKAEALKDGSKRVPMSADERDSLSHAAQAVLEDEGTDGATRNAARALVKWLARPEFQAA
jgi:hypothetical protein